MYFADEDTSAVQALRCLRSAYRTVEETPPRFAALLERLRDASEQVEREVEVERT